jgi:hypothetical protein
MYCGRPTTRGKKGEHIIPEALGGKLTLLNVKPKRIVCPDCNTQTLSNIDKELCSRSYLSAVASKLLDKPIWQVWDIDHVSNNLLVEARPIWDDVDNMFRSLAYYPQITFEENGPQVRCDIAECVQFGRDDYSDVLIKAALHCFGRYRDGDEHAFHLEKVRSHGFASGCCPTTFHEEIDLGIGKRRSRAILYFKVRYK